ncbi:MAG: electron transfer flavoprotein subunit alpha/FixB family protein [Acidobacteria bacterium]|nr:electron transfer flavoprotein subunit alpha/FixB family protein [Acidobacteriota bacterium]MCB9377963.1 electron transfer flavoprotein subunit alpha/FixB family protein [Holophagales bacterium]
MSAKIWAVLQQREGKIHRMAWECVAAAQRLAEELGGQAEAVLLGAGVGPLAEQVAASELAAVRTLDHPLLDGYTPGGYVASLAAAIGAESPDYVLFPHTYQSVEYVPLLAQTVGGALVPEAVGFEVEGGALIWRRPILTGKLQARVRAKGEGVVLVSLQSGAFSGDDRKPGQAEVRPLGVELETSALGREVLGVEQAGGDQIDLTKAEVIVAVGRGVGGADKMGPLEELAGLLRADLGASRPVIDAGWLPRDRQIGSSGQTVAPKLYIALGISGAIQHLVGMKGSSVIVAVNKDAGAPIFKVAHYGIVGDLHEVVPAINSALKERAG